MTELLIDKQRVVLPMPLSIPLIEENPFFTKNGKYTLDITLSLEEEENAKIYKHINRLNAVDTITGSKQNRSALLIVDNEVVLNGTEIIRECTESQVKIQLVSGNTELNFLIEGDRKLRDLDLGKAEVPVDKNNPVWKEERAKMVYGWLQQSYPERDWQLLPYYQEDALRSYMLGNAFRLYHGKPGGDHTDTTEPYYPLYAPFYSGTVPQPYFCFIIRKTIEVLGYTLSYNALAEHPIYKDAYIVNGYQTLFFAKMLPEWTVTKFAENIERLFDCTFVVDPTDKTVRLLFNYQKNDIAHGTETIVVFDEYVAETDADNKLVVQNSNMAYSLDSNDYNKYMHINERYLEKVKYKKYGFIEEMLAMVDDENNPERFRTVFTDGYDRFMAYKVDKTTVEPRKIDSFRPLLNNPDSEEIDYQLDIIPAPMVSMLYDTSDSWYPDFRGTRFYMQLPVAVDADPLVNSESQAGSEQDEENFTLQELIEGESETQTNAPSKIRLAIYAGISKLDLQLTTNPSHNNEGYYPISYVESLAEYATSSRKFRFFGPMYNDPFRFSVLKKEIYDLSEKIDTTKTYKFMFHREGKINIKSKFIANNKAFSCVKLEREITTDGFSDIVKGDFYPYNNEKKNIS